VCHLSNDALEMPLVDTSRAKQHDSYEGWVSATQMGSCVEGDCGTHSSFLRFQERYIPHKQRYLTIMTV
jgi:hypothetical protein